MYYQPRKDQVSMRHFDFPKLLPNGSSNSTSIDLFIKRLSRIIARNFQTPNRFIQLIREVSTVKDGKQGIPLFQKGNINTLLKVISKYAHPTHVAQYNFVVGTNKKTFQNWVFKEMSPSQTSYQKEFLLPFPTFHL